MPGISSQGFTAPTPPITGDSQGQATAPPVINPNVFAVGDYGGTNQGVDLTGINQALLPIPLLGATTQAMNLYVDPVAGLDTNPGTVALPFRTIAAALAAVPQTILHVVTINFASGDYNEAISPTHHLGTNSGALVLKGALTLAGGEADRTADVAKCSASTIGSAGAAWAVDVYEDKWVHLTAGTGSGQVRKILSNTADTLSIPVDTPFNPVPDGSTHYQIETPGARILGYRDDFYAKFAVDACDLGGGPYTPFVLIGLDLVNGGLFVTGSTNIHVCYTAIRKRLQIESCTGYILLGRYMYLTAPNTLASAFGKGTYICEDATHAFYVQDQFTSSFMDSVVVKGKITLDNANWTFGYAGRVRDGAATHGISVHGSHESGNTTFCGLYDGLPVIDLYGNAILRVDAVMLNCTGGFRLNYGTNLRLYKILGSGNAGPILTAGKNCVVTLDSIPAMTVTVTGGGLYKAGNRPVGTAWADLTTYGPDDDGADQKVIGVVPGGGGAIATSGALFGAFGTAEVKCIDLAAPGVLMVEDNAAPAGGHFQVNYGTGAVTFNAAEAGHTIRIMYRPVSYTGARIG